MKVKAKEEGEKREEKKVKMEGKLLRTKKNETKQGENEQTKNNEK